MGRQELYLYKQMPKWTKDTVPEAFLSKHNTAEGTWGHITVTKGRLKFYELDEKGAVQEEYELSPEGGAWMIAPQQWHKIEPLSDDLEMQLEFYCTADDYFSKKYGMSATHSAVRAAEGIVPAGKALDMGCGQGRNALFLALKGFDVTAVDNNPHAVQNVAELARAEGLPVRSWRRSSSPASRSPRSRSSHSRLSSSEAT